jgi:hypothetical protein
MRPAFGGAHPCLTWGNSVSEGGLQPLSHAVEARGSQWRQRRDVNRRRFSTRRRDMARCPAWTASVNVSAKHGDFRPPTRCGHPKRSLDPEGAGPG